MISGASRKIRKVGVNTVAMKSRRAMVSVWRTAAAASAAHAAAHAVASRLRLRRRCGRTRRAGRAARSTGRRCRSPASISLTSKASMPSSGTVKRQPSPSTLGIGGQQRADAVVRGDAAHNGPASAASPRASATVPSNRRLPPAMIASRSHSRSACAMTWVENRIVAPRSRCGEDQRLEPFLVDRIEARKGLVEHQQFGFVHDRSEQLDQLRHALRQLA